MTDQDKYCDICRGNGWVLDLYQKKYDCPKCKGTGEAAILQPEKGLGMMMVCPNAENCKRKTDGYHCREHRYWPELCERRADCRPACVPMQTRPAFQPEEPAPESYKEE